jgi:acyl-CoA dehydrogenase
VIGGSLKRKEKLSARLGDVLSLLYLSSCALKFYEDQGRQKDELPLLTWGLHDSFFKLQVAMDGIIANFPNRFVAWWLRRLVFPRGLTLIAPSDRMGHEVADLLINPTAARSRLIAGIYLPKDDNDVAGRLEAAMHAVIATEPIDDKIRVAQKAGRLTASTLEQRLMQALELSVITSAELQLWKRAQALRRAVIMVDDFDQHFGKQAISPANQESKEWQPKIAASM